MVSNPTGDRARQILFSNPYYIFQLQLTVRQDEERIKSLADCKNRVVGTLATLLRHGCLKKKEYLFGLTPIRLALIAISVETHRRGVVRRCLPKLSTRVRISG